MKERQHRRRELLGLTSGAGFAVLAGCVGPFSEDESDPEFEVSILGTNGPVESGSILEVTVSVENVASDGGRDEIVLDVAGLQPSTNVFLEAGESTQVALTARINMEDSEEIQATVQSSVDSDTTTVTILRSGDLRLEISSFPEEIVEGETLEVALTVSNDGEVAISETVSLEVNGMTVEGESVEVSVDPGGSQEVTLEWDSEGTTGLQSLTVKAGQNRERLEVSVLEAGSPTIEILSTNAPIVETQELQVTVRIGNEGEDILREAVSLSLDGTELASENAPVDAGDVRQVTLSGTPDVTEGEYVAELSYGEATATVGVEVQLPVRIVESTVPETVELAGELIEVTLENRITEPVTVRIDGTIEISQQQIQIEPPRATSQPIRVTYEIPEGTHENSRTVTVSGGEVTEVPLKIATPAFPFDLSYLPGGEAVSVDYEYDVSLTKVDGEETDLQPRERIVVSSIDIAEVQISQTLYGTVRNISDEAVNTEVVGILEDAGSPPDENIEIRKNVLLAPGDEQRLEFEGIGGLLEIPTIPFIEIDGMRENSGFDTGLVVNVEEI